MFTMGSPDSEPGRNSDEGPQREVKIAKAFAVSKFDVTREEYAAFVRKMGNAANKAWQNPGIPESETDPVVDVSWDDAQAYVKWLNAKTGQRYRLLSEAEWEYSARAGTTTAYSWGAGIGENHANCDGCGSRWDNKSTSPVGSFAPNSFGLYDMSGNVWQWVQDSYGSYRGAPLDGSPVDYGTGGRRVLRGGSWHNGPQNLRAAQRFWDDSAFRAGSIGFRVARTLSP